MEPVEAIPDDSAAPIEAVLIDWAGTITAPLAEIGMDLVDSLDLGTEATTAVLSELATYLDHEDNIFHRAERGDVDDDDLRAHLDAVAPGAGEAIGGGPPSLAHAPARPEMLDLLAELADAGVFVVLATNNFRSSQETLAATYLDTGLASALVNSAMVGIRKPDPAFFELCLELCAVTPDEVLLVDDHDDNLAAAAALGIRCVKVGPDPTAAIAEVRRLALPES